MNENKIEITNTFAARILEKALLNQLKEFELVRQRNIKIHNDEGVSDAMAKIRYLNSWLIEIDTMEF